MGSADSRPGRLRVSVAWSAEAGHAFERSLELEAPATALDAIRASGVLETHPALTLGDVMIGIWGRACASDTVLADGDRVELYRPLTMDPNEARRLRAKQLRQGKRPEPAPRRR